MWWKNIGIVSRIRNGWAKSAFCFWGFYYSSVRASQRHGNDCIHLHKRSSMTTFWAEIIEFWDDHSYLWERASAEGWFVSLGRSVLGSCSKQCELCAVAGARLPQLWGTGDRGQGLPGPSKPQELGTGPLCPTLRAAFYRALFSQLNTTDSFCVCFGVFCCNSPFPPSLVCGFLVWTANEGCFSVASDGAYS